MRRLLLVPVVLVLLSGCGGGLVTAHDVGQAFQEEGLPLTDARDTSENCETSEVCATRITSEDVSIYGYWSESDAAAYAEACSDCYQAGPIVLNYATSQTPEEYRADYERVLDEVVGVG